MVSSLGDIISTQPEAKYVESAISSYMDKHYTDDKLPQITCFFNQLISENNDSLLSRSLEEKVNLLFSEIIPLITEKNRSNEKFKIACSKLKTKFHPINIDNFFHKIASDFIRGNYKALIESAIAPALYKKPNEIVVSGLPSSAQTLSISDNVRNIFNNI